MLSINGFHLDDYVDKLYRFSLSKTHRPDEAEDLTQDILAAALCAITDNDDIDNPENYLMSIAKYTWYAYLRKKYKEPVSFFGLYDENVSNENVIHECLELREDYARLRWELSKLARLHRDVVTLYYFKNLSIATVALKLGISEGTVKSRLFSAKKQMKRGLTMDSIAEASFKPHTLSLGINGHPGRDNSPFNLVKHNLLAQNILIEVYQTALSERAIGERLGVSTAYIEAEVEKLVAGELMIRHKNGMVQTDFCIVDKNYAKHGVGSSQQYLAGKTSAFTDRLIELDAKAADLSPFKDVEPSYRRLLLLMILQNQVISDSIDYDSNLKYPIRPYGGKWYAMGFLQEDLTIKEQKTMEFYDISGALRCENDSCILTDYNMVYGTTHFCYIERKIEQYEIRGLLDRIYQGGNPEENDEYVLSTLLELEILSRTETDCTNKGGLSIRIPIFTSSDWDRLMELMKPFYSDPALDGTPIIQSSVEYLIKTAPSHLKPQFRIMASTSRGYLCMSLLKELIENGTIQLKEGHNYPVMWMIYK